MMTTAKSIDLIASAQNASDLIGNEVEGNRAEHAFKRELGKSKLSHFGWFYLLATLLELAKCASIDETDASAETSAHLEQLIAQWEHLARCKFQSAEAKPEGFERQFIEHGATCYFNCAQELRAILVSALPPSSATPSTDQN